MVLLCCRCKLKGASERWAVSPCPNGIKTQGPHLPAHPLTHPLGSLCSATRRLSSWSSVSKREGEEDEVGSGWRPAAQMEGCCGLL